MDVVIKTLKPGGSETDAEDLRRELAMLQLLRHPHIVRLAGAGQAPQVLSKKSMVLSDAWWGVL